MTRFARVSMMFLWASGGPYFSIKILVRMICSKLGRCGKHHRSRGYRDSFPRDSRTRCYLSRPGVPTLHVSRSQAGGAATLNFPNLCTVEGSTFEKAAIYTTVDGPYRYRALLELPCNLTIPYLFATASIVRYVRTVEKNFFL
jgi:hypothetical protein